MATLNLQVGHNDDDAKEFDDNNGFSAAGPISVSAYIAASSRYNAGARFDNVTIGNADTIDSAVAKLHGFSAAMDFLRSTVFGEDVNDADDFNTTPDVTDRTHTAASVDWVDSDHGVAWITSPEIKVVIQEIVDRGGWASGNALVLLIDGQATADNEDDWLDAHDTDPAEAPKLDIDYTAAGIGADEMMAAIGQQAGGGGGSGDIMAHSRKPPEAVAY